MGCTHVLSRLQLLKHYLYSTRLRSGPNPAARFSCRRRPVLPLRCNSLPPTPTFLASCIIA